MNNRIKEIRKDQHLTQTAFAERIGMKQNSVAQLELGRHAPSNVTLRAICREFHVSPAWLEFGEGEKYLPDEMDQLAAVMTAMEGPSSPLKKKLLRIIADMPEEHLSLFAGYFRKLFDDSNLS